MTYLDEELRARQCRRPVIFADEVVRLVGGLDEHLALDELATIRRFLEEALALQ
jgi:hypothetical protein